MDLIAWSWSELAPALSDPLSDPGLVSPYLSAQARSFYWELHFEKAERTRTDFLHRVAIDGSERADFSPDPVLPALVAWYGERDTASRCHPTAWLELDGPLAPGSSGRAQGVSVCLDPGLGGGQPAARRRVEWPASTVLDLFGRLQRRLGVEPRAASQIERVHGALARAGGAFRHLSLMRGRAASPAKIYAAVPRPALTTFLREIGWPGDQERARRLADLVCADSERINLDLQSTERLSPRLGFELFFDPSPARDPYRTSSTAQARALGLLSAEQEQGLQRWVGLSRRLLDGDQWPTRIQRWFDLKFVLLADGGLELKAYLGFRLCQGMF